MPRVNTKTKNKAGKAYNCDRCGEPIRAGEQYHEWSFRYGGTHRQHASHGNPRASQLTQSKLSGAYAAIEGAEDSISGATTAEDIAQALTTAAEEVEQVRDEYQESLDSMGENFAQGAPGEAVQEKIDALEEFASALNDAASEIEGEEPDPEPEVPASHKDACKSLLTTEAHAAEHECDCGKAEAEKEHEEWEKSSGSFIEDLRSRAQDALAEFSL
jgi:hypothetical protein